MARERLFRFKQFAVCHAASAMKVGTDAVSIGAWAPCFGRMLDVGCGCGIIGLMAAQRGALSVDMVEIDSVAADEAAENAKKSPWSDRIIVHCGNFLDMQGTFDTIVSNPPYFASGVLAPDDRRSAARHEGQLNPETFMRKASQLLAPGGLVSVIVPTDRYDAWAFAAKIAGLYALSVVSLLHEPGGMPRRIMATFSATDVATEFNSLAINSPEYKTLTHDFYL